MTTITETAPPPVIELDDVTIRFAGDSGDGIQLTGQQFTVTTNLVSFFELVNTRFRTAKQEQNAENDSLIGALPERWNHLVGYNPPRTDAALVHYTLGGPYFSAYEDCEYADDWRRECDAMLIASAGVSGGKKP